MLPLYEAKMIHLYDTRWATYESDETMRPLTDSEKSCEVNPMPRYWVAESDVDAKLSGKWDKTWMLVWRDICRATDIRTLIATCMPRLALGNKLPIAFPSTGKRQQLQAAWSSFACDYVARQKLSSTTMNYFILMQLAVPGPTAALSAVDSEWVSSRVDRLNGWINDRDERARVRAELDAYYFHLYGLTRGETDYVMETFPIVKRKDEAEFGSYRTKELILAAFDHLALDGRRSASDEVSHVALVRGQDGKHL